MKPNKLFWILWVVWFILNVLTGMLQEIYTDEAYYYVFGQFLDWGYFDHPPMVGLMARLSDLMMGHTQLAGLHNLTVRLMTILTHAITIWMVWLTVQQHLTVTCRTVWTFFMVLAGLVMFATTGFMLTPDSPLLLFVALFYYAYQQYLQGRHPWLWAVVLGFAIAGMCYSKYMAVLVVLFAVLSNWRVLKDGKLWCAIGIAALLLMPHIGWQISHDFPTLRYHLLDRHDGFDWINSVDYWPKQLLVFNPVSLILMLIVGTHVLRQRQSDPFRRTLAVTILGFLGFFWLETLKGRVEPHWTMTCSVPAIILLTEALEKGWSRWMQARWLRTSLWCMAGICLLARITLWTNRLPLETGLGSKRAIFRAIHEKAGDRVVVFEGSFQWVSLYRFWEGESVLMHGLVERHTQYELWDWNYDYQGRPACIVSCFLQDNDTTVGSRIIRWKNVEHLQLTDRIQMDVQSIRVQGDSVFGQVRVYNPYSVPFVWPHSEMSANMLLVSGQERDFSYTICVINGSEQIAPRTCETYTFSTSWRPLTTDDSPDNVHYILSICTCAGITGNSTIQNLIQP